MKMIKTLSVALLATTTAMAQNHKSSFIPSISNKKADALHKSFLKMAMGGRSMAAAQRSTGTVTKQRVIAENTYADMGNGMELYDTVRHWYPTNAGGSRFDFNNLAYNSSYDPTQPVFPGYPLFNTGLDLMNDSMRRWSMDQNNMLSLAMDQSFTYNNNKVAEFIQTDYTGNATPSKMAHDYDAQGKLNAVVLMDFNGSSWDTTEKHVFHYNTANKVVADTFFGYDGPNTWSVLGAYNYAYDGAGNITQLVANSYDGATNSWQNEGEVNATYYPSSNKLKMAELGVDMGGNFMAFIADTFGYTGNSEFSTYWREDQLGQTGMEPNMLVTKHLNANQLPDSVVSYYYNGTGWDMNGYQLLTYNSYNNPETMSYYSGNPTADAVFNYFYEEYQAQETNTAVNNTPAAKADISVYPNPSSRELNIRWNGFKQGDAVAVTIMNAAGQVVSKTQMNWMQPTETINIASLQPGMYWMSISNASGKVYTQSILKQ